MPASHDPENAPDATGSEEPPSFEDALLELNDIVWRSVRGAASPMPPPRRAAFVFTSADEDDDDDEDHDDDEDDDDDKEPGRRAAPKPDAGR